jgi:hypothetical protein
MILVDTITLTDVESGPVSWLWEPYIPSAAVSLVIGDGGTGKSFYSLAIAAAVTKGEALPGDTVRLPPSDVIVQNAENPPKIIKKRLELLGADCSKVHIINEQEKRLSFSDERLEAAITQHNAKLCLLDPIQSYLGQGGSMNNAESVRAALTNIEQIAERTNCTMLIIGHLNKAASKSQYRALGSIDIYNAVPSILYLGKTEPGGDVRAVVHGKANYDEAGATQLFSLSKADGFRWLGESGTTLDELLSGKGGSDKTTKLDEAAEFLRDLLQDGATPHSEIAEYAANAGISKRTLERVKRELGVKSTQTEHHWEWSLDD